ncbi:uncharacterized protein METZ01_LOCUS285562 [marine metagenome]|uniref:Uncharacterized protein n=1 Tax=marine metagenome TaxID=408172 RepID=A0A382L6Z0_9ZZZZ
MFRRADDGELIDEIVRQCTRLPGTALGMHVHVIILD